MIEKIKDEIVRWAGRIEWERHWRQTHTTTAPTYHELAEKADRLEVLEAAHGQAVSAIQDQVFAAIYRLPQGGNRNKFIRIKHIHRLHARLRAAHKK